MKPPLPPTDNLYKFVAITGLLLFLACIVAELSEARKISLQVAKVKSSAERIWEQVKKLEVRTSEAVELRKSGGEVASSVFEEFESELESLNSPASGSVAKLAEAIKILDASHENYRSIADVARWGEFVGIFLMGFGFTSWYMKLQKYQDRIVKRQAEESSAS